jgi:RNA polymerase sigma-70 factor (ECF subfamily)
MADSTIPHSQMTRLLMQHRTALYGYIFACVRNHDDVTESIARLSDEAGFLPWAREIARRRVLAHRRSTRREQPFDPELVRRLAEAAERVERAQPASRLRAALTACLESSPTESRRLILMRYEDSAASAEELAARFGRSVQGIYAWIKRIKTALRECVERRLALEGRS